MWIVPECRHSCQKYCFFPGTVYNKVVVYALLNMDVYGGRGGVIRRLAGRRAPMESRQAVRTGGE